MISPRFACAVLLLASASSAQRAIATVFGPVVDGRTGSLVAPGGDMDNDAVPDFLVSSPDAGNGRVHVVSGRTHTVRTIVNPVAGGWATDVLVGTGDMNLDGVADLVVGRSGNLIAYSGATLTLLWQTAGIDVRKAVGVDDLDNDGRTDLAVVVYGPSNTEYLWTLRGSNGTQIAAMAAGLNGNVRAFANLGDIDNDGHAEVAYGNTNGISIHRTSPPSLVRSIATQCYSLATANLVGDARNEILSSDTARVFAWSATTGALVRTYEGAAGAAFTPLGDLDADGVPELAIRSTPGNAGEGVDIVAGATATRIGRWLGTQRLACTALAATGDVDGDGFGDLLIGDEQASVNGNAGPDTGGWQLVSGKLLASMTYIPVQCAGGPWFPQLGITRPILGSWVQVEGRDGPAFSGGGVLALSSQPALPTNFGVVGCDAWWDVTNWALLYQPGGGYWSLQVPIPNAPQLAGLAIALQAFYVQTNSPIGMDLTNGIWARLGY